MTRPGFSWGTPVVFVRDLVATLKYYEKILGFDRTWLWSDGRAFAETERPTLACVVRGDYGLFLSQKPDMQDRGLVCLNVRTYDDLDFLFQEYKLTGAHITEIPQDRPWGMRDMAVQDPDGNILRIGLTLKDARASA